MPPINANFAEFPGFVNKRIIEFYRSVAKGGVGLIIVAGAVVDERARRYVKSLAIYKDDFIDGLSKLAEAIKSEGAVPFLQLNHTGRLSMVSQELGIFPVGPSSMPHPVTKEMCRELLVEEISEITDKFIGAAKRLKSAGFEGLELHGAHGYLLNQFFSNRTNRRTDDYGKDLAGRMKFPLEVVRGVRSAVGEEFPISYRISAIEFGENEIEVDELRLFAMALEKAGVNLIHVSGGASEDVSTVEKMVPHMSLKSACFVPLAEGIKKNVDIPIIVVGKINTPRLGEWIIGAGKSDMIAMGRALIADPELPSKAAEERTNDIRRCIYCNQGCMDRTMQKLDMMCTVNPAVGREEEFRIVSSSERKRIFVIGGGPGGMEVARVLALRNYDVTLYEKEERLGGQILLASLPPGKRGLIHIVIYYKNEMKNLGVVVKLNTKFTSEMAEKEKPDIIVLATGSNPIVPVFGGIKTQECFTYIEILKSDRVLENDVAVIGGQLIGLEVALFLASKGMKVKVIEKSDNIGTDVGPTNMYRIEKKLRSLGVQIVCGAKFVGLKEGSIEIEKKGRKESISRIKTVVFAIGSRPNDVLEMEIKKSQWRGELLKVGNCSKSGKMIDAIHEGFKLGLEL
jgi:2,4-dienoyl-CoA reductase-like NADH-dependent reductase (Old Yellow Enzyme family)/thioredoxin reductase